MQEKTSRGERQWPFVFIAGGCRSGKSAFAQKLAEHFSSGGLYIATAWAVDAEMSERIRLHRELRGKNWRVYECPPANGTQLAETLPGIVRQGESVLFDCLSLWVAGLMAHDAAPPDFSQQLEKLLAALQALPCPVLVVSTEVGMGLVPDRASGRAFRDMVGLAAQRIARTADTAVLMVSGLPLVLKGNLPANFPY
ncbi:bifunctional adenosylcobinamide kinase/adenosylcobinamide-phosphate guanylyltransferase [Desulfovibrio sp. OttesenSCG-928-A18]|nr:bifunctional adenosylcobinamide kinase/adenosylcobinamide-phosphate guanylyltransferase [Desulfovibrio sp. OttesenSCG-928-A18]